MTQIESTTARIEAQISAIRRAIASREIQAAREKLPSCDAEMRRLAGELEDLEESLEAVPPIEVVVLGPSRHGKSTLLNSLAGQSLLPTSDIKPCTAAIVTLRYAESWSVKVKFVGKEALLRDWRTAVNDAKEYLQRLSAQSSDEEAPDDPKYLHSVLQRFIQLFQIEPNQGPEEIVRQVATATIPAEYSKLLGGTHPVNRDTLEGLQEVIIKYLSTQDVWWTIVESCEIEGPLEQWHPHLNVLDLPGTNDTNPHRTAITNRLRDRANAVAIVTSDSNLGTDIESWLRNSTVLADFLEAKSSRRQRLFIVRTKFDSYHPEIAEADLADLDEEDEERLEREMIQQHKDKQKAAYHEMLREIVLPMLPAASADPEIMAKRQELLDRVFSIEVFFVSAFAHEAFEDRIRLSRSRRRTLEDIFKGDVVATGVPSLRDFLNEIAADYLAKNYFEDISIRLEQEAGRLVRYFRSEISKLSEGGQRAISTFVSHMQTEVLPWVDREAKAEFDDFHQKLNAGGKELLARTQQIQAIAERRLQDKLDKWSEYAWNSLRATARKRGVHTTCNGKHIDIIQDICSVLVDDLILAWSTYRDNLIDEGVSELTAQFASRLRAKLHEAAATATDAESQAAISDILEHVNDLSLSQRQKLLSQINGMIKQIESIRQPAYDITQRHMGPVFDQIEGEHGQGCAQRMRSALQLGFHQQIGHIQREIADLIEGRVRHAQTTCESVVEDYVMESRLHVTSTVCAIDEAQRLRDQRERSDRIAILQNAARALPSPEAYGRG